jgi:DNA-directed RNA polymerase subunit RPC12/RpoP
MEQRAVQIPAKTRKEAIHKFRKLLRSSEAVISGDLVCHKSKNFLGGYYCRAIIHKRYRCIDCGRKIEEIDVKHGGHRCAKCDIKRFNMAIDKLGGRKR